MRLGIWLRARLARGRDQRSCELYWSCACRCQWTCCSFCCLTLPTSPCDAQATLSPYVASPQVVEASQRGALEAQKSRQKALEIAAKLDAMAEEHLKQQHDPEASFGKLDIATEQVSMATNGSRR